MTDDATRVLLKSTDDYINANYINVSSCLWAKLQMGGCQKEVRRSRFVYLQFYSLQMLQTSLQSEQTSLQSEWT